MLRTSETGEFRRPGQRGIDPRDDDDGMWQDISLASAAKVTEANNVVVVHLVRRKSCAQNLETVERTKLRKRKGTFALKTQFR